MAINSKELQKLAVLVNKTVHSIEFPEEFHFAAHANNTLNFLYTMEVKHGNNEMLTSIRSAIVGIPQNKMQFFKTAHNLFAQINGAETIKETPAKFDFLMTSPNTVGASIQVSM